MTARHPKDDGGSAHLELRDLRKEYSEHITAVDGLSLSLSRGELLVMVGPSGCGKSTTLRLIAGLETVTDGDVRKDGESLVDLDPKDRDVAMVFQNYALYPHMTAKRNMTFGLQSTAEFDDDTVEARVQDAADLLDIADLLDRKPEALSGLRSSRSSMSSRSAASWTRRSISSSSKSPVDPSPNVMFRFAVMWGYSA